MDSPRMKFSDKFQCKFAWDPQLIKSTFDFAPGDGTFLPRWTWDNDQAFLIHSFNKEWSPGSQGVKRLASQPKHIIPDVHRDLSLLSHSLGQWPSAMLTMPSRDHIWDSLSTVPDFGWTSPFSKHAPIQHFHYDSIYNPSFHRNSEWKEDFHTSNSGIEAVSRTFEFRIMKDYHTRE
jgi:hypothetical protein